MRDSERPVDLLCTVRGCREVLERQERRVVCSQNHSFDVARSGYINLLQPQDRRSRNPGDTKEAALARRAFYERGFVDSIVERIASTVNDAARGPILDVGCGEGFNLGSFSAGRARHGVDISVPAIDLAARKHRDCAFVVANADRFLPYQDASFAVVTSITARLNASEFARVLRCDGVAVIAVAGADDLIELREAILGEGKLVDRAPDMPGFTLVSRESVRTSAGLDRRALHDVLTSSYRAMRTREREKLAALDSMDVTLSRELFVFTKS